MLLGADIGGTFTDLVWWTGTQLATNKVPTTPENPQIGLLAGIEQLQANREDVLVIHGSTVATNALLERKGARVVLVTTAGFRDVLEIARQNRIGIYDPRTIKPVPLVPAARRVEVRERLDFTGQALMPLDAAEIDRVVAEVKALQPEAIAVCLLHAYANPAHERRLGERLHDLCPFVYLSSDIDPAYREYERTSTTVLNAYVAPLVARYVQHLRTELRGPLRLIGSNGGRQVNAELARPASMILSGPAGGVIGARAVASAAGLDQLITLDMGGTSTDLALIPGTPHMTRESVIEGLPLRAPMLDIYTIGAGGGSLARLDRGGALVVGPESAGAQPGPACYDHGGVGFTVTDAHVLLGHVLPERFLGGRMALNAAASESAAAQLVSSSLPDVRAVADGVLAVTNATMERAIRAVSARRGYDPEQFTLFCFGGAGGLHAVPLARALGMRGVLIPRLAGVLSALGMVMADVVSAAQESVLRDLTDADDEYYEARFALLGERCVQELRADGTTEGAPLLEPELDLRYRGQSYELLTSWAGSAAETALAFHHEHTRRYGYADPGRAVEVVSAHMTARVPNASVPLPVLAASVPAAPVRRVAAWFDGREWATDVYLMDALARDQRIEGPAILAGEYATVLLPPSEVAVVDKFGNVRVSLVV